MTSESHLLNHINSPHDLKRLTKEELPILAQEIRDFILDELSVNPGHVGSSLGVVELTIALHYVYDTPYDSIIWDVGHQAYAHKILTGRRDSFHTLRKEGGISGFPVMSESVYDAFGTGHSSTSVSAALGMALADKLQGIDNHHVVAVIGDGAITAGMFFEALNHAGGSEVDMLIILNDNGIAIDKSSGVIKDHLQGLVNGASQHNIFKAFNASYYGPVDGNDILATVEAIQSLKDVKGVKLLHLLTKKGKGFTAAEDHQTLYHAPGRFDRITGETSKHLIPLYQDVFGDTIAELAKCNPKIVAITPAMASGSNLIAMMERFPDRVFDVGIAEQHAVTLAAGLSCRGMTPYCCIYSTFLQRAMDQLIHDVAIQKLPVVFCIDRAGVVGRDGATHHGIFDIAFLNSIPNVTIAAPMNEVELRNMLYSAQHIEQPIAIRYPRGEATMANWKQDFINIDIGKARLLSRGSDVAIISLGAIGNNVSKAINTLKDKGIAITHLDLRFLRPLDEEALRDIFTKHHYVITIEDGVINGGMGSRITQWAQEQHYDNTIICKGIADIFPAHASQHELHKTFQLDEEGIIRSVTDILRNN